MARLDLSAADAALAAIPVSAETIELADANAEQAWFDVRFWAIIGRL